ncbi:MAG: Hsp70 family protein [Deltaproteobacteria bacterium]|nr:Hsp70 family protein [Deltaproteobacteria bacterium]
MSKIIGIDLGTTNTVAAFMDGGQPIIIPDALGKRLFPSVVASVNGAILVGRDAKNQDAAETTIASVKRHMGTGRRFNLNGRDYAPQEISAMILQKIKANASAYLGEHIDKAVITVPAYFNNEQRQATRDAGIIAGLEVKRIINEPTAAALAYGLGKEDTHTVMVWDLGGGTFDVSILEIGQGIFEVRAVNGDTHLGGDDWDQRIAERLSNGFLTQKTEFRRFRETVEETKIALSCALSTTINIPGIMENNGLFEITLTRKGFEEMTSDLVKRLVEPTMQALADAALCYEEIDRVILVGGATRMPAVQELARKLTGREPYKDINPDEAVALGAAIQAGILTGEMRDVVLVDVTPLSLGIESQGGVFAKLIDRNTQIPVSRNKIFTTAEDDQTSVDIHILQGEKGMARYNMSLGNFRLTDITSMPAGTPRLEVQFTIDSDGILKVSAKDLHTDNERMVEITSISRPSFPDRSIRGQADNGIEEIPAEMI